MNYLISNLILQNKKHKKPQFANVYSHPWRKQQATSIKLFELIYLNRSIGGQVEIVIISSNGDIDD